MMKSVHIVVFRVISVICLFCITSANLNAQRNHFSQFYFTPYVTNPSYAGNIQEDIRLSAVHRSQWVKTGSSIKTSGGAFDMNFEGGKLANSKIGLGVSYIDDQLIEGLLGNQEMGVALVWHQPLDGINRSVFSIGVQGVLNQVNIAGPESFLWGSEFDQFNRPQELTNDLVGEDYVGANLLNARVNAGISFSHELSKKTHLNLGFSMFNLNKPASSLYTAVSITDTNRIKWQYNSTAGIIYKVSPKVSLEPSAIFSYHAGARNLVAGTFLAFKPNPGNDHLKLFTGPWYRFGAWKTQRLNNALIIAAGVEIRNIKLGFSYDLGLSSLNNLTKIDGIDARQIQTFEFTLVYLGLLKRPAPNDYTVPCKFF